MVIVNSVLSGCYTCVTPGTSLSVYVTNSDVHDSKFFIYNRLQRTNVALSIEDSTFDVLDYIMYVEFYQAVTQVSIEVRNSSLIARRTNSFVISGAFNDMPLSYINVTVRDSFVSYAIDIRTCSSHVTFDVQNCTCYGIRITSASTNALIHGNPFPTRYGDHISIRFCDASSELAQMELPHQVTISNNSFPSKAPATGAVLSINAEDTQALNHVVVVSDNHFLPSMDQYRRGIYILSASNDRLHSYTIASNRFTNMGGEAIRVFGVMVYFELTMD